MTVHRRSPINLTAPRTTRLPGEGVPLSLPEWTEAALCAQIGPVDDMWFPSKGGSTREAKRVCGMCEVRADCLAFAMKFEAAHSGYYAPRSGVFGGLSPRQRHALARERDGQVAS